MEPRRRLRSKTSPAAAEADQNRSPLPLELPEEAPSNARRQAYLITFPFPKQAWAATGEVLVPSAGMPKKDLVGKVLDAFANPVYVNHAQRHSSVPLERLGDWRESHAADEEGMAQRHDHVACLAEDKFYYMPVKRALLQRRGLASHWSCTHDGYS